jgi:hypothetical protein
LSRAQLRRAIWRAICVTSSSRFGVGVEQSSTPVWRSGFRVFGPVGGLGVVVFGSVGGGRAVFGLFWFRHFSCSRVRFLLSRFVCFFSWVWYVSFFVLVSVFGCFGLFLVRGSVCFRCGLCVRVVFSGLFGAAAAGFLGKEQGVMLRKGVCKFGVAIRSARHGVLCVWFWCLCGTCLVIFSYVFSCCAGGGLSLLASVLTLVHVMSYALPCTLLSRPASASFVFSFFLYLLYSLHLSSSFVFSLR